MFDTPNWRVNPTALRARIDAVTRPNPTASVTWFISPPCRRPVAPAQPLRAEPGITEVGVIDLVFGSYTSYENARSALWFALNTSGPLAPTYWMVLPALSALTPSA